jgi:uroporphyrinogen-III synthase
VTPLQGLGVLVTRPRERAAGLCGALQGFGARPVVLPTIAVEAEDTPALRAQAEDLLGAADRVVFVSPAAVDAGLALFRAAGVAPRPETQVAAVGAGTAAALTQAGWPVHDTPAEGAGADALLAAALHQVAGERIVIVRGDGGREGLAEGLRERGARVDYLPVYRRVAPSVDVAPAVSGWREGWLRFTIVTSATGLRHLLGMLDPDAQQALRRTRVITVSPRLAEFVRGCGFEHPARLAGDPSDQAVATAVCRAAADDKEKS